MVKRYITTTSYPEGLTAEEKTLDKAIVTRESYEVSKEELEWEAEQQALQELVEERKKQILKRR